MARKLPEPLIRMIEGLMKDDKINNLILKNFKKKCLEDSERWYDER